MKLKYKIIFQQIGNQYIGVAVGEGAENYDGMLLLNEVGYDIVQLIDGKRSEEDIVSQLLEMYDVQEDVLSHDVYTVVQYLKKEDVLK